MNETSFAFAILLVTAGGLLTGSFAVPMKYLTRWRWENIWLLYALMAMVVIPTGVIGGVVPNLADIYSGAPRSAVIGVLVCGYLWGLGSVTFGIGVDRLGMGLGFSLIMGISTLLGTLLPFFLAEQVKLKTWLFAPGLALLLAGVAVCGYAGNRRETDVSSNAGPARRGFRTGLLICLVSGVMSSLFNVGMMISRPVQDLASKAGAPEWASGNTVWPILLGGGFLANVSYCGYLLRKNGTAGLFLKGGWKEWAGGITMGAFWIGGVMMYGAGAFFMGELGPILGWPMFTSLIIVCAYFLGRLTGEWSGAGRLTVRWMNTGIGVIVLSLFLIGFSR
jgi:L-rhamnose-H+ transport protein